MILLVINKLTRNLIRGEYKKGHSLEPVEIALDKYILNYDAMILVEAIKNPRIEFISNNDTFVIGDGSALDIVYQDYLSAQLIDLP